MHWIGARTKRRRRESGRSLNWMIPNAMTLLGLSAGISAVRFAIEGSWDRAVIAITVAAVLDGVDGRIARALGVTSRFGAELDSLSDFVCFGVSPALVIYLWSLNGAGGVGWSIALIFAVCCAIRLARFNSELDPEPAHEKPAWAANFFTGVPAPAGGGLALMPLIWALEFPDSGFFNSPVVTGATMLAASVLMVSRIPTMAAKRIKVPTRFVVFALIGFGVVFALLISEPWLMLGLIGVAYIVSIPVAMRRYEKLASEGRLQPEESAEDPESEPGEPL
jgi:CDP-diacylglycerol--serine O-phosphatidyltransferase